MSVHWPILKHILKQAHVQQGDMDEEQKSTKNSKAENYLTLPVAVDSPHQAIFLTDKLISGHRTHLWKNMQYLKGRVGPETIWEGCFKQEPEGETSKGAHAFPPPPLDCHPLW